MSKKLLFAALFTVACAALLQAQSAAHTKALSFLRENPANLGLTAADVADVRTTDEYISKHNGVTHVWFQQQHLGTPVFNGLFGLHVTTSGTVKHLGHRFVYDLASKVNSNMPSLSADRALELAISGLDFGSVETPRQLKKINERNFVFDKGAVSRKEIPVSAYYWTNDNGTVRLAWSVIIDQSNTSDYWNILIDAQTGQLLHRHNYTTYCSSGHTHRMGEKCQDAPAAPAEKSEAPALPLKNTGAAMLNGTYNVFALPVESPAHGSRTLLTNPANATASPFGWHDTNGQAGNEFTFTRGNNVWAYNDLAADNTPNQSESAAGGSGSNYDFPFDPNSEPESNLDAAVTNLFYMNNMMHDITYVYGFDEQAGNFQSNNYGKGGNGADEVFAEALDSGGTDNANFATPPDGSNPRMQMYDWSRSGGNLVTVNSPAEVAGVYFGQTASGWGGTITTTAISANVILGQTSGQVGSATQGCEPLINNVQGKIAMIDRGQCEFGAKALNAENAGAVACIICNFDPFTVGMGAGAVGASVTIPVLMMSSTDCNALKQYLASGLSMTLQQPPVTGPDFLDGDFDNGIIAHEYGHGISNRLTGGPSNTGCLGNAEQMGEGWSDFFSLALTTKTGDTGIKKRGVGTYVTREPNNGLGIRRFVYSTDMVQSPLTYGDVAQNTGVHAIGEVWNNMLWDLYWAMVDKYGFDPDLTNTDSGNGRAIQLVMDGMKLQPCSPGFEDGRDAILLADELNYNSADTCLITSVFARRGMGITASQGASGSATDGTPNFDPIALCIREIKIKKETTTPTINPGEIVTFKMTVTNHKGETATNVVVTETLPQGLTAIAASTGGGTVSGNTITWNLGDMPHLQVRELQYAAQADLSGSTRLFRDVMDEQGDWFNSLIEGSASFALQNQFKVTGTSAWKIPNLAENTDVAMTNVTPLAVTGNRPTLRFWTRYWVEQAADGGFLETAPTENGPWSLIPLANSLRDGYNSPMNYSTTAIPSLNCFSGNSSGWKQAYISLSHLNNTDVNLRFRYGSDADDAFDGWYIDDLELLDLLSYNPETCVTTANGDNVCATAPREGVIVNPGPTDTKDTPLDAARLEVRPNPATNLVYITLSKSLTTKSQLTLTSTDGRLVAQRSLNNLNGGEAITLDVTTVPAGIYTLRLENGDGVWVEKLVVR
jgi:extracellular elastinolytic metalloproteinase